MPDIDNNQQPQSIVEQKKAEEVLRQIELIVENSFDAIIGETLDGIITSWNGGATRMFGYSPQEMVGKSILQMLPPEMKDELSEQLNKIKSGQVIADYDTLRIKKDGSRINVAVSMSPVKLPDGTLVGASVVERDITVRKKSEESMRQVQLLVENSLDAIISTSIDGVITTWNGGAQRMFGYTAAQAIGKSAEILNPPEMKNEVKVLLDKIAAGVPIVDYDTVRMRKDSTRIDVSYTISPIQTKDGTVIGASTVIHDNTQRNKDIESMRQIQLVVDNSYDAIISETPDGTIKSWNQGAQRMLGYSALEVIGKPASMLVPPELIADLSNILSKIKAGEVIADHDAVRIKKDGSKINISLTIAPIKDKGGTITGAALVYHDITERKKKEEVLRQIQLIVENSHDAIIGETLDGIITSWNGGARQLFGYTFDEIVGKPMNDLSLPETKRELPKLLEKVKRGEVISQFDSVWQKKDTTHVDVEFSVSPVSANVEFSVSPMRTENGKVIGASLVGRDITDRKKDEARIKELNDVRSKFIDIIAHQLRTPIGAVNWNLESILNGDFGKLEETQYRFLQATHESSLKITSRIHDLLTAMDIEEKRVTFEKREVALDNLVGAVIAEIAEKCKLKNVSCQYVAPEMELPIIEGDNEKIRTAISKVVENALMYTKENGKIVAKLKLFNDVIRFEVTDTGVGVPKAEQHSVFSRFFRASNAPIMQPDAFGLGLFIAKNFIQQHGGKIGFESEEGKGSTFWFEIPLKNEILMRS